MRAAQTELTAQQPAAAVPPGTFMTKSGKRTRSWKVAGIIDHVEAEAAKEPAPAEKSAR